MVQLSAVVSLLSLAAVAQEQPRPPVDLFLQDATQRDVLPAAALGAQAGALVRAGRVSAVEPRLGVPTFFWAARDLSAPGPRAQGLTAEQAARRALWALAPLYRADPARLAEAPLRALHDVGEGAIIATFGGERDGRRVFRDELKVILDRALRLVAVAGYLTPQQRVQGDFALAAQTAVAVAWQDLQGQALEGAALQELRGADAALGYRRWALPGQPAPARTREVYFPLASGLEPGIYVELDAAVGDGAQPAYYAYVVSARDGRVLYRKSLTAYDAYAWRVWADPNPPHLPMDGPQGNAATPHPTGTPDAFQPAFVTPSLVTLSSGPIASQDAWLPAGATETRGNNSIAYADVASPNGFSSGDLRAQVTAPGTFDRTYDVTLGPAASADQRMAAVAQLFYDVNFFHDWYYDVGFDEASGNAQQNNLGRGGVGSDPLLAEGQDYSGTDNANMSTPSDGASPRMQMYVWSGGRAATVAITVNGQSKTYTGGLASFGPQLFNLQAEVVLADDGAGGSTTDACEPPANASGKIVVADRGTCTFVQKAQNAQAAGAVGLIIANNTYGGAFAVSGSSGAITIPVLSVSRNDGTALKQQLAAGVAAGVMERIAVVDRDGTIDNTIVAHEWGHYISNRLIGDGNGLSNNQGVGMGEGWADFHALLMVVRAEDAQLSVNAAWKGVYGLAAYAAAGMDPQGYYWGIRRVPYSTDFARNALTFKHITQGVALPSGVPTAFGADGRSNAEVHATGEVWATMLWEAYAALLNDTGRLSFEQAQDRMKRVLVAGYKATPMMPTFVEARDAILAVAAAANLDDFALISAAFARRGLGMKAVAPSRDSQTNSGAVESFLSGNDVGVVQVTLDDSAQGCDHDGVLDANETGVLKVALKNTGTGPLGAVRVQVRSASPGVTVGQGGSVQVAPFGPFATTVATVPVSLGDASTVQLLTFDLEVSDPTLVAGGPVTVQASFRANADVQQKGSDLDDVEAPTSLWTPAFDPSGNTNSNWRVYEDPPGQHRWFGPNPASPADTWLLSPPLAVEAGANFGLTFQHRYEFEADANENYDGAVIEFSTDDGKSWSDVGAALKAGYPGALTSQGANPLKGRQAFVGKSPNYPAFEAASLDFGPALAGKTVRLRFRIGADDAASAKGWEIDDLKFFGLAEKPFPRVVVDPNLCTNQRPVVTQVEDLSVAEGDSVTLTAQATDPDGEPVTLLFEQRSGPIVALAGATFTAPEVDQDSELVFDVKAFDGRAESLPVPLKVAVRNVNRRPQARVQGPLLVRALDPVVLEGEAVDPDGDAVTVEWTQLEGPAVRLSGADRMSAGFVAPLVREEARLVFELVASDARGAGPAARLEVVVSPIAAQWTPVPDTSSRRSCGCASGGDVLLPLLGLAALGLRRRRRR